MDENLEIYIVSEMRQTAKLKVSQNLQISQIFKLLKLPENYLLIYQGIVLQKGCNLKQYDIKNGTFLVCLPSQNTTNDFNFEFKNYIQKQKQCLSYIREKARLSDLAQISIDNNPRKFRRFVKNYQSFTKDSKNTNSTTLLSYESPCSPSSEPLPISW